VLHPNGGQRVVEDTVHNLLADARSTPEKASRFCSRMERASAFLIKVIGRKDFWADA